MNQNIIFDRLRDIEYGSLVRINWLDACTIRNARFSELPLPNYYVETRRTTIGSYITVQKGEHYNAHHLLVEMDSTEGSGSQLRSIPTCLIYKIDVSPVVKTAECADRSLIYNKFVPTNRDRVMLTLRDGSVKLFD